MANAVFGNVGVPLHLMKFGIVVGARSLLFFNTKVAVVSAKGNLGCEASVDWWFYSRIMEYVSALFGACLWDFGVAWKVKAVASENCQRGSIMSVVLPGGCNRTWWCWMVTSVALCIVPDIPYVRRINHEGHFAWQAQYLMVLDGVSRLHCAMSLRFSFHMWRGSIAYVFSSWQAQHLVGRGWRRVARIAPCNVNKEPFICDEGQSWER